MMEPMSLGSPSNSGPSSPQTTPSATSPFLPSFLLGEPPTPNQPASTSPKAKRTTSRDFESYTSPRFLFNQTNGNNQTTNEASFYHGLDKSSGPPIRGLFDTVTSPAPAPNNRNKSTNDPNSYISNVSRQFDESSRRPHYQDSGDTTWVTVFGYPPAAAAFILSQLAVCGNIISKQVPATGNWMHVQYSSKVEAKRALSCNGKVYGNSVMIGVVHCRDPAIVEKSLDRSYADMSNASGFASPLSARSPRSPGPGACATGGGDAHSSYAEASVYESPYASPRPARPLAARHDNEMYGRGNTPQRSSGVVSKAMEYILGW